MRKYSIMFFIAAVVFAVILVLTVDCSWEPPTDGSDGTSGTSVTWLGPHPEHPADPQVLDAYYNETDCISYIWNGASWDVLAIDGMQGTEGDPGVDGEPGLPGEPSTSINWLGSFDTAPVSPSLLDAYYNTTDGTSYIWDGDSWEILAVDGETGAPGEPPATPETAVITVENNTGYELLIFIDTVLIDTLGAHWMLGYEAELGEHRLDWMEISGAFVGQQYITLTSEGYHWVIYE